MPQKQSEKLWANLRDLERFTHLPDHHIWKISVPPSSAPQVIADLEKQFAFEYYLDWAGGLIWLAHAPDLSTDQTIRRAVTQGHAMLFRAEEKTRATVDVFQPQARHLKELSARVKQSFDPRGLFNPGRMYKDI